MAGVLCWVSLFFLSLFSSFHFSLFQRSMGRKAPEGDRSGTPTPVTRRWGGRRRRRPAGDGREESRDEVGEGDGGDRWEVAERLEKVRYI